MGLLTGDACSLVLELLKLYESGLNNIFKQVSIKLSRKSLYYSFLLIRLTG